MIFFITAPTGALKWTIWYFKQTSQKYPRYAVKPTIKSSEPCSRMASTFYGLISLGSFVFVRHDIPEVSQFSISSVILKSANLVQTLRRLRPSHTRLRLSFECEAPLNY